MNYVKQNSIHVTQLQCYKVVISGIQLATVHKKVKKEISRKGRGMLFFIKEHEQYVEREEILREDVQPLKLLTTQHN